MMIGFRSLTKMVLIVSLAALSFATYGKVVEFERGNVAVYDFQIDDVLAKTVLIEGQEYFRATFKGVEGYEGILYKKGHAEIPVVRFYVEAESADGVKVIFPKGAETRASLDKEIYPAQDSLAKVVGSKLNFVKDNGFYKTDHFWPGKDFDVHEVASVNGKKRFQLTIYPMQYNPVKNRYRLRTNFLVEVEKAALILQKGRSGEMPLFVMIAAQQFKNSPALLNYVAFKQKLGFVVEVLYVGEDVETDVDIRSALKARLSNELKYAMLIGDNDEVPSHVTTIIKGVTDHYYRAIDTDDYLSDINGPDIGVGRITPKNETELANTLAKFIRYQSGDFSHEEWLNRPAFIGTDDKYLVAEGSHNYAIENYTAPRGYVGFFPEANIPGGDRLYAITHNASDEEVVEHIRDGRFLVNYSGHGGRTSWAGPDVSQSDVRSLTDEEVLPFVISNACITGDFRVDESFGETWIKHPAGAVMFWGSMDSSYWDEDDIMEKRMYDGIFRENNRTFASITQYALSELWRHYGGEGRMKYYWETYVTFGDPSIELRTGYTETPTFEGLDVLPIGIPTLKYVVLNPNGLPYSNVMVSLTSESGVLLSAARTNALGEVILSTDGAQVGENLAVAAYGGNIKMTPKNVLVVSPDAPYLVSKNFTINDQANFKVSPLEEITVKMALENVSDIGMNGGELELIGVDGDASIIASSFTIPALEGHEIANFDGNNIRLQVGDLANGTVIVLHFRWTTVGGDSGEFSKKITVVRGNLEITAVDFGNPDDALTGGMAPGGNGQFYIAVTNTGMAPVSNAQLALQAGNCMVDLDENLEIEYVAPGETIRVETAIGASVSSECANEDLARFTFAGTYQDKVASLPIEGTGSFVIGRLGRASFEADNLTLPIVDKETTEYVFEAPGIDKIKDLSVHVRITHTYQGDIEINLVHPNGTKILLRKRSGGGVDNIDEVYGVGGAAIEQISQIQSLSSSGSWKLEVYDGAASDQGTLDYVKIDVIGYIP